MGKARDDRGFPILLEINNLSIFLSLSLGPSVWIAKLHEKLQRLCVDFSLETSAHGFLLRNEEH